MLSASKKAQLGHKYGINKYAVPKVSQGIPIGSERSMPGTPLGWVHLPLRLPPDGLGPQLHHAGGLRQLQCEVLLQYVRPDIQGPAWAEEPSNPGALGPRTTTSVVQHPESLQGKIKEDNVRLVGDPARNNLIQVLVQDAQVKILRKGINGSR